MRGGWSYRTVTSNLVRLPTIPSLSWDDCRLLVESVVDYAIFMLDAEGRVATWNLGAERIKGYRADEIVGQHFSRFYPPEDLANEKPARALEIARREGRFEDEGFRVRKDGSRFWASVVITALRDPTGELRGYGKVTRDLTARRDAEEQTKNLIREKTAREVAEEGERRLKESEARYRALSHRLEIVLEGVADGITVQDRSGRLVFANTAAAKMCGFATAEELLSTSPAEIMGRFSMLDSEGKPFLAEALPGRRVLAGQPPSSAVIHVREHASDREWWVLLRANAVYDADGHPELAINIWHDVSAERAQEKASEYLTQATTALGSSLSHDEMLSALGAVLVPGLGDFCGIYLLENDELRPSAVTHADPAKAGVIGDLPYPLDRTQAGGLWSVIRSAAPRAFNDLRVETLLPSKADRDTFGALAVKSALLAPIRVRDRMLGVVALASTEAAHRYDVNDMALVEELGRRAGVALENAELYRTARAAASSAERAAKLAEQASRAKDDFLAVVSHELRTPLNAIMGWAKLLTARDYDEPKRRSALETIERNAIAMAQLIEDLLDMSRVISGKMRLEVSQVDLAQVVEAALDSVRPAAAARNIELSPVLETPSPRVMGDSTRLQQIVWNLLSNAVKFSSKGGRVDVVVRRTGSRAEIVVRDRGKGISPEFLPSVFDPFRQEDASPARSRGGLGLGLAITRQLVELHGGRISAESQGEGCGSTFTVRIPLASVAHPDVQSHAEATRRFDANLEFELPEHLRNLRILVVDDEADSRHLVATTLK
jgi:PAS domain S-box-containing protein